MHDCIETLLTVSLQPYLTHNQRVEATVPKHIHVTSGNLHKTPVTVL